MAAFSSNIDITSGGTYAMDVTNGETSAKVATDLNGKFANIQELLQNGLPEVWTGDSLPDSLPTGKIIVWNGVMYTGGAGGNPSGVLGFTLRITFASQFSGKPYTVQCGTQTINGTVPSTLYTEVTVATLGVSCTISCESSVSGVDVYYNTTIPDYYGYKSITFSGANFDLNQNTWSEIRIVSDNNQGANYWSVGAYKNVNLSGTVGIQSVSGTYRALILGFNHNSSREGNNRIHFMIGKNSGGTNIAFCDSQYSNTGSSTAFRMNTSNTNVGGWNQSYMRNTILHSASTSATSGSFMYVLPSDLRNVLKSCTKYTDNSGNNSNVSSNVTVTTDYLWLCAEFEVQGARTYANQYEQNYQQQYQYFRMGNAKIKYGAGSQGSSTAVSWWLRSPSYSSSYSFCSVNTDGGADGGYANLSLGVAPCFCV